MFCKFSLYRILYFAAENRQIGFSVYVFNDTSYIPPSTDGLVFSHDPECYLNQTMDITVNRVTKGVTLYNANTSYVHVINPNDTFPHTTIEICEVRVMGRY